MENNENKLATNVLFYTNQCQLACQYCYQQQRMELSEPFMAKFEDFKDTLDKLALNPTTNNMVSFGGEPTLCMDAIYDTINYTNTKYPNKFTYYINTNGIVLSNEDAFNKFKDFYFNGNNNVTIVFSYDGSANFRRKFKNSEEDSTKYVLKAINLFNDNNIPFNISYCLNYFNYEVCIKDFIQIILKWKNLNRIVISVNYMEMTSKLGFIDLDDINKALDEHLNAKCLYLYNKFKKPICDRTCSLCRICHKTSGRNYIMPNKEPIHKDGNNTKFDIF